MRSTSSESINSTPCKVAPCDRRPPRCWTRRLGNSRRSPNCCPGPLSVARARLRLRGAHAEIQTAHQLVRTKISRQRRRSGFTHDQTAAAVEDALRTGMVVISPAAINTDLPLAKSIRAAETALDKWYQHENLTQMVLKSVNQGHERQRPRRAKSGALRGHRLIEPVEARALAPAEGRSAGPCEILDLP